MPQRCKTCDHPRRAKIEAQRLAGSTLQSLSDDTGITTAGLARHFEDHIARALVKAHDAAEVADADDLLAKIRRLETDARRIQERAEKSKDFRAAIACVREQSRIVELLAKLAGELRTGHTTNILVADFERAQAVIVSALDRYPDAKLAVIDALGTVKLPAKSEATP